MNSTFDGTRVRPRSWLGTPAVGAVVAATLTLVPALAGTPAPVPVPYVELRTGLEAAQQYARLVDGDEATADPQQNFESLVPLTLASDPQLLTVGARGRSGDGSGRYTSCLAAGEPITSPLPEVQPALDIRHNIELVGRVPWLGVKGLSLHVARSASDRPRGQPGVHRARGEP